MRRGHSIFRARIAPLTIFMGLTLLSARGGTSGAGGDQEGGAVEESSAANTNYTFNAVVGENVNLTTSLFPEAADEREIAIDAKWDEIEIICKELGRIAIPDGYPPTGCLRQCQPHYRSGADYGAAVVRSQISFDQPGGAMAKGDFQLEGDGACRLGMRGFALGDR